MKRNLGHDSHGSGKMVTMGRGRWWYSLTRGAPKEGVSGKARVNKRSINMLSEYRNLFTAE